MAKTFRHGEAVPHQAPNYQDTPGSAREGEGVGQDRVSASLGDRVLSTAQTRVKCGNVARNTLCNWVEKQDFPKPVQLSPSRIGWLESEVDAWLASRPRGFLRPVAKGAS